MQTQEQHIEETNAPAANETHGKNTPDVLEIGKRAVQDWKNGDGAIARGQQRAIYCCALAWNTVDFIAVIQDKKTGAITEQWTFDLETYMNSAPKKEDGSKDNKKSQAQHVAVFKTLFGVEDPDSNQKNRIKSALQVVNYLYNDLGFDETDLVWDDKKNRLEVPFVSLEDEPDADAEKEEKQRYANMKGETVALTGKRGRAVADLERRAKPKADRNKEGHTPDKGKSLINAAVMVEQVLTALMDEKVKSAYPSPNKEMRKHLWKLSAALTRYFESDTLTKEEEAEFEGNGQKKTVNTRASKG